MTKSQLIEAIAARRPGVSHRVVEAIVNAVFEAMAHALESGERIEIRGFGSFAGRTRPGRDGRNPKTGQPVQVPPRRTLTFTVGKELRDRLNTPQAPAVPAAAALPQPVREAPAPVRAPAPSAAEPLAASAPRADHYTLR